MCNIRNLIVLQNIKIANEEISRCLPDLGLQHTNIYTDHECTMTSKEYTLIRHIVRKTNQEHKVERNTCNTRAGSAKILPIAPLISCSIQKNEISMSNRSFLPLATAMPPTMCEYYVSSYNPFFKDEAMSSYKLDHVLGHLILPKKIGKQTHAFQQSPFFVNFQFK